VLDYHHNEQINNRFDVNHEVINNPFEQTAKIQGKNWPFSSYCMLNIVLD